MKVLFDQGTPAPLRKYLKPHVVETTFEKGWSSWRNGALLARAEAEGYEVLVTTDQNLRYQQNLTRRKISIVVWLTTSWPRIKKQADVIKQVIDGLPQAVIWKSRFLDDRLCASILTIRSCS